MSLSRPSFDDLVTGHEIGDAALAVACGLVAALILVRRPRHSVALLFAAVGITAGFGLLCSGLADAARPAQVGYRWAIWLSEWSWVPGLLLIVTVLPLVFPEGTEQLWQRWLLRAELVLIAAVTVGQALSTPLHSGPHSTIANPVGVPGADIATGVALVGVLGCSIASLVVLILRMVHADQRGRRQLLPLFAAGVVVVVAFSIAGPLGTPGVVLQDACFLLIPAAALLSVLRLRLYDIELAIGRSVTWAALSGVLIGVYVLVVQVASTWLHVHGRLGSVIATAVIALAFGPVRGLLQRWIGHWLYGDRGDPYAALAHTTQVLSGGADPLGALERAAEDLAYRLRSPGVRILRNGVLLVGRADGRAAIAVPLRSGAVEVGRLEISPRAPGETFSRADERLILDLCAPLANAVAAVGLTDELSTSRERLAVAREAERRRVRGELHDDVGPSLAAAALQAQTARRRLQRDDTAGVDDALTVLSTTIAHAASDLRSVIDALGPRALEDVGLADAVRSLACCDGAPRVVVDVEDFDPVLPVFEVVAYRVISEALTNAHRHAQASAINVRLRVEQSLLDLAVCDDGIGGAASRPGGLGIHSMQARIEELGGNFSLESTAGLGTAVRARLPIAAAEVSR
ncbi:histidine kinase [Allobranchiibius sp. CTAmp26]|uniref:sensor histidine kinase n=1 Tax=Allobranchiibius sp. CTAmp26 TaxID=2815214 RepID=UPI001AA19CFD|nr:histidine kinase [Allobranchiibius sp. CTAmp26]MBO1755694.1 hypothetical protein [Allobranchiibius sp. CTAmp26]